MKLKALVIEDSRLARQGLVRMLQAFADQIEVLGQAENAAQALQLIEQLRPDVLFLDIHLPGDSGMALLAQLPAERAMPRIIFTTAYSDYAIRSFDFNTVDYLLKPISPQRLAQAMAKLTAAPIAPATSRSDAFDSPDAGDAGDASDSIKPNDPSEDEPEAQLKPKLELSSKIFIKDGERCHLIALEEIVCLESCKNYARVFFGAQQSAYVKRSLNQIEQRLPSPPFFRASRQYIVNLQAIRSIAETIREGYEITMSDHRKLEISRRQALALKDLLSF